MIVKQKPFLLHNNDVLFSTSRQSDENTVPAFVRYSTFVILLLFKAKCICFFVGFSKDIRISGKKNIGLIG